LPVVLVPDGARLRFPTHWVSWSVGPLSEARRAAAQGHSASRGATDTGDGGTRRGHVDAVARTQVRRRMPGRSAVPAPCLLLRAVNEHD